MFNLMEHAEDKLIPKYTHKKIVKQHELAVHLILPPPPLLLALKLHVYGVTESCMYFVVFFWRPPKFSLTHTSSFFCHLLLLEQDVLRDIEDHDMAGAISHFFNCFFGTFQSVGTKVTANNMQSRTHRKVCVTWIYSFRISYSFFGLYCFSAMSFLWANCWGHKFP